MVSFILADVIDYCGSRLVTRACLVLARGRQERSLISHGTAVLGGTSAPGAAWIAYAVPVTSPTIYNAE